MDLAKLGDVEIIRWGPKLQHKYATSNCEQNCRKIKENEIKSFLPVTDTAMMRRMFGDCVVTKGTLVGAALKG